MPSETQLRTQLFVLFNALARIPDQDEEQAKELLYSIVEIVRALSPQFRQELIKALEARLKELKG
jgi:hypothetical protein